MKLILSFLTAAALSVSAQEPFTYETPAHLFSTLDANGDAVRDLVVIDRNAGTMTVGFQSAGGIFTWSSPEPTGIPNATGLAAGNLLTAGSDAFAVTSRTANRVSLFSLTSAVASPSVRHVFPEAPAAKWIAALNIDADATAELIVSSETGASYSVECLDTLSTSPVSLWTQSYGQDTRRINPLRPQTTAAPRLANLFSSLFYMDEMLPAGTGSSISMSGSAVTTDSLYATGYFGGSSFATAIVYEPGATTARSAQLTLPAAAYVWGAVSTLTFPSPVRLITVIPAPGGSRLAVLFTDGSARTYDYSGSGSTITQRGSLAGPFDFIAPVGTDSLLGTNGNIWQRYNTANTDTLGTASFGNFPQPSAGSRVSNVVYLNGEPFANPAALPTANQRARDWTTAASGGPASWTITSLQQLGGGLSISGSSSAYTPPVSSTHALVNQYRTNISVRSLEGSNGPLTGDIEIQPPAGAYPPLAAGDRLVLTFVPNTSGDEVYYRLNASGAWQLYNPAQPPGLTAAGSVEAYAAGTGRRTPIRSASYTFSNAPLLTTGGLTDADGDGMSDQWEKTFGITSPTADADGDGVSNLAEFQTGTDPLVSNGGAPLLLNAFTINGGSTLRLEWSSSDPAVILQQSPDLNGWTTVSSGITNSGGTNRYDVPLAPPAVPKRYFRLKRP